MITFTFIALYNVSLISAIWNSVTNPSECTRNSRNKTRMKCEPCKIFLRVTPDTKKTSIQWQLAIESWFAPQDTYGRVEARIEETGIEEAYQNKSKFIKTHFIVDNI
jgi:hypothetical protein